MKTKKAILAAPGRFEIIEEEIAPKAHEILARVAVCGLCNWELNHWKGLLGEYPQALGHEWAGEVVETGRAVKHIKPGDRFTGLGGMNGFAEYMTLETDMLFKLGSHVDTRHALGEPLKCVVTVLRATGAEAGDAGVVLGCGPMGLWCVQALAGRLLSSLIAVDVDDKKLALARQFGATHTINSKTADVREVIRGITGGHMADFVIEGTGIPGVLNQAVDYLRAGRGRLVLMSSHEEAAKDFDFRGIIGKSAELRAPHPSSADLREDMRRAIAYLNNGTFRMERIITHTFRLEEINRAFQTLENKPADYIKGVVIPHETTNDRK